jgi:hypothetical protein
MSDDMKGEEMKRREFLLKAAETAALALFGSIGLSGVAKAVESRYAERQAINEMAIDIANKIYSIMPDSVNCCGVGSNQYDCNTTLFFCNPNDSAYLCGDFVCDLDFQCGKTQAFNCQNLYSCDNVVYCASFRCWGHYC